MEPIPAGDPQAYRPSGLVRGIDALARRPVLFYAACIAFIMGSGYLDILTGEETVLTALYLIPVGVLAWGKGFGTEMAAAVLRYGFLDLKLPRIAGMANLENLASQRVLLKIGLERRGERAFAHPDYAAEGPMAWFERDAADWRAERGLS